MIGAAAAAEHSEVSELPAQVAITPAEIGGITNVEIGRCIELRMAARRSVRPQSAQTRNPRLASAQCVGEMRRMRAIEHVVGRRVVGFAIGLLDRVADRLPARQTCRRFRP